MWVFRGSCIEKRDLEGQLGSQKSFVDIMGDSTAARMARLVRSRLS